MADRLSISAAAVASNIDWLKVNYPELSEDADLLAATIEGETDFERVMEQVVEAFLDAVSNKGALADRMSDMRVRSDRFDAKAEAMRALATMLMSAADATTVRLPIATVSLRNGPERLEISDVKELPQGFTKTEIIPLKSEIKTALKNGEDVPGARLVEGEPSISVRTK